MRVRILVLAVVAVVISGIAVASDASGALHTWSDPIDLTGSDAVYVVGAGVDPAGDAVVVTSGQGALLVTVRRDGVWSSPSSISTENGVLGATVHADSDGRFSIVWVGTDPSTYKRHVKAAVVQPGATVAEPAQNIFGDHDSIVPASTLVGSVLAFAATISDDGGSTYSLIETRCDFTAAPLCEQATNIAGVHYRMPIFVQPAPGDVSIAWVADDGDVEFAPLIPGGIGQSTVLTTIDPEAGGIEGWSGNGHSFLQIYQRGVMSMMVADGTTWGQPFANDLVQDIAFAPDGTIYELVARSGGLSFDSTTDGIVFGDSHQLTTALSFHGRIRVAPDGSLVVVWGDATTNTVQSAVLVDGVWQTLPSPGTYDNCGGGPVLARGNSIAAIAYWGGPGSPYSKVAEMQLVAAATSTTIDAGVPVDLAPAFTC